MIKISAFYFVILFNVGCSSGSLFFKSASTSAVSINSIRWEEHEFQELSQRMLQNILVSKDIDFSNKKFYFFDKIKNDTHDHIDTEVFKNRLISALTKSSKFTFVQKNKSVGDYLFHGKISSIFKKNKNGKDMFFNFNLTLVDRKTSVIIWSHELKIRKVYKKSIFSW